MANSKVLMYQLWPFSWGGIRIMTSFLPRIANLGVDYVWLSPIFKSPMKNHGRDVSDYYTINSRLGSMEDFDEFVRAAHALNLKVILDLPIDSTSVEHNWFYTEPLHYIWGNTRRPIRQNLLGRNGSAWQTHDNRDSYYLCLSNPLQPNLNWFRNGVLNRGLVEAFKKIMRYWLAHNIDGFRIESVQLLNEDMSKEDQKFSDLLIGSRAVQAVRELSNLYGGKSPFLIMDVYDNQFGSICDYYAEETDVEFITNKALKSTAVSKKSLDGLQKKIENQVKTRKFMLDLECSSAPRFTSRSGVEPLEILKLMFSDQVQAVCLYQGQELGLKNPQRLSMEDIIRLDPEAAYKYELQSASFESLKQTSCATARVPIPLDEYAIQESDPASILTKTKTLIKKWKHSN